MLRLIEISQVVLPKTKKNRHGCFFLNTYPRFKQTKIALTLCSVTGLVEIWWVFWGKTIFKSSCKCIFTFLLLSPFEKERGPLLKLAQYLLRKNKCWTVVNVFHFDKGRALVWANLPFFLVGFEPSLAEIGLASCSGEEDENLKSSQTDRCQTIGYQKNSLELLAQVSLNILYSCNSPFLLQNI